MATTAFTGITPEWITPDSQLDEKDPTRYEVRPLTAPEKESIMVREGDYIDIPVKNYYMILRMGVLNWENFNDEKGQPLRCAPSNHKYIPEADRFDLAIQILALNSLSEEQEKN